MSGGSLEVLSGLELKRLPQRFALERLPARCHLRKAWLLDFFAWRTFLRCNTIFFTSEVKNATLYKLAVRLRWIPL
jgi:hypothetical protein